MEDKYNKYYKYKSRYESKYKKELQKIHSDETLTLDMKNEKVKQLRESKIKCMNCQKSGGNIFGNESGMLTISCGNVNTPCDVGEKYNVESTYVENLRNIHSSRNEDMKVIKNKIIYAKLDYLFGFTNEETALSDFEVLKRNMKSISKELSNTEAAFEKVVKNKEKEANIRENKQTISKTIQNIKANVLEYEKNKNEALLGTIIEIYRDELMKQNEEYRDLKYEVKDVLIANDDKTMSASLIQLPFQYESLYVSSNRADSRPKWNELSENEQNDIMGELLN